MGYKMIFHILASLLLGTVLAVPPEIDMRAGLEVDEFSTNLDTPNYRLTDAVQPRNVYVDLDVYLQEARFNGLVELEVEVQEDNLSQIVLHQKVVSIQSVNLVDSAGRPVNLQFPSPYEIDNYYEILIINLADPISIGNYSITVRYTGAINLNQYERGFYRGHYFFGNEKRYYATTQFQPYYARMAFPCFDEPQFKSRFVISITRDANLNPSYSNMPISQTSVLTGGRVREVFYPTPIVSSYLVAFTVSDFVETNYTSTATRPFGIVSRPGVNYQHPFAAEIGLAITNEMDDYFGIKYYEMGQGQPMKNDHLAIPDFPAGAMENWGMVNYREAYLLYDEQNTNLINKVFIATIMAHELAHKWFGNLVTCFWWSNLWLNESFASLFEYFSAHDADPSLELDDQFVVDQVHSALNWDAGAGATPMNLSSVASNPSISAHFSTTSYAKGASVLRMMEHFLGARAFRMGLRYYLRDNAYGIGTPEDLYTALRRAASEDLTFTRLFPDADIGEILDSWVQNPGSPVVNVHVNMTTGLITLSQERFLVSGATPPAHRWHIPITWTHSGNFNWNTRPSFIFSGDQTTIQNVAGHNFVILNIAQSGLYRVNYDDHNWEMIANFLQQSNNNRLSVHKLNRAQMVNDVLYFIRAGKIDVSRAFDVLAFLRSETDYYVWAAALGQLDWIRRRLEHLPVGHEWFTRYMLHQMNTVINHLGYEEAATDSTSTILNRMQIMNVACNLGHAGCISNSLSKWNSFKANATNLVPVNQRRYVYCIGLREGDSSDYDFLYNQYMTSENAADMVVILRALGCTKNTTSLNHYLQQTLVNDRIRTHDRTNAFAYALQGNKENLDTVLDFLFNNVAAIREEHGGEARLNVNINNLATFLTDFDDIERFRGWANANNNLLGASSFNAASSVIATALNNLQWGSTNAEAIHTQTLARSSAVTVAAPLAIMLAALAVLAVNFLR